MNILPLMSHENIPYWGTIYGNPRYITIGFDQSPNDSDVALVLVTRSQQELEQDLAPGLFCWVMKIDESMWQPLVIIVGNENVY